MTRASRVTLILLVVIVAIVTGGLIYLSSRGFSAREEPSAIEAWAALRLRNLAIPGNARGMTNPVPTTPESLHEAMQHFADHCAVCHGNDGGGMTDFGHGLYPPPPDMKEARTQDLTDGELFYIIENGIRFTGMPGFATGTAEGSNETWKLVQFIRHLPKQTPQELEQMKAFAPKTSEEWREEQEAREFLEGGEKAPAPKPPAGPPPVR